MKEALTQSLVIAELLLRSFLNALRRRQSKGSAVLLPLLLLLLALQLWRFGVRAARGVGAVLAQASSSDAVHYASFWLTALLVALTALKLGRTLPEPGHRRVLDTPLLAALPLRPLGRLLCELTVASGHGLSFALLVLVPVLYGIARHGHNWFIASVLTILIATYLVLWSSLLAVGLRSLLVSFGSLRLLNVVRTLIFGTAFGLFLWFMLAGPMATTELSAPRGPIAKLIAIGLYGPVSLLAGLPTLSSALLSIALSFVLGGLAGRAAVLWLESEAELVAARPVLRGTEVQSFHGWAGLFWGCWRMARRHSPALVFGPPAFLAFFMVTPSFHSSLSSQLRGTALALCGWALAICSTAVSGAVARRERRALLLWIEHAPALQSLLRMTTLVSLLQLAPLMVLPIFLLRMNESVAFTLQAIVVFSFALTAGVWAQTATVFLCVDPAPDRVSGLTVIHAFAVMGATLPAGGVLLLFATAPWQATIVALLVYYLFAWSIERSALARLRWLFDPDGDVLRTARVWPALRAWAATLAVQSLFNLVLGWAKYPVYEQGHFRWVQLPEWAPVFGVYLSFSLVLLPWARMGWGAANKIPVTDEPWSARQAWAIAGVTALVSSVLSVFVLRHFYLMVDAVADTIAEGVRVAPWGVRWSLFVLAGVVVPIVEEFLFRGWLTRGLDHELEGRWRWLSVPLVSYLCVLQQPKALWLPMFLLGIVGSMLVLKTGSLRATMVLRVSYQLVMVSLGYYAVRG